MPDGVHEDKLGTFLPVDDEFAATWRLPGVLANERRCYSKDGDKAARLMLWWSGGKWWVGKRAELGLSRGWVKVLSDDTLPPRKGWAVLSAKVKPAKWKEAIDLSCEQLGVEQSSQPKPRPSSPPPVAMAPVAAATTTAEAWSDPANGTEAPVQSSREITERAESPPPDGDVMLTALGAVKGFKALLKKGPSAASSTATPAVAPTPMRAPRKAAAEPSPRRAGGARDRLKSQTHFGKLFQEADVDGSGSLTREELAEAMRAKTSLSDAELDEFFAVTDRNGDGKLTALEAIKGFKTLQKEGKLTSLMAGQGDAKPEAVKEELGA